MNLKILNSQHVFIAGQTGSGKTFLATRLVAQKEFIVVLDTKNTFNWGKIIDNKKVLVSYDIQTFRKHLDRALKDKDIKSCVYKPDFKELTNENFDYFFQLCYFSHKFFNIKKSITIFVDEVMSICPNSSKIPLYYKGILTRGRELNVSVWSLSQRPASIPVVIYSESTHWFIFNLVQPDRKRLVDFTGYKEFFRQLPKYNFWYWDSTNNKIPVKAKI